MTNTLSVYLSWHHGWPQTEDYLRRLDPAWIRIHQPDAMKVAKAQELCPNAKIMLRSWDIDDHNGERKAEMYADPKGAAVKHLNMWLRKRDELRTEAARNGYGLRDEQWYYGLVNEPDPARIPQIYEYTAEAMAWSAAYGMRLGVCVPSVGNFAKPGEHERSWATFKPLEKPIRDGGHILIVHEYWQPEGPDFVWTDEQGNRREDAGNLAWRHHSIPLDVPILIGEAGVNGYLYNRHTDQDNGGWRKYVTPNTYAAQVQQYIARCDTRVQGVCLYMTDYHNEQWESFDTHPAHEQLLAVKDVRPGVPSASHSVYLPNLQTIPSDDNWRRAYPHVLRIEGGLSLDPNDPGNWYQGKLVGTKFGISAAVWGGQYDIPNLTEAQALDIYRQHYWRAAGCENLPWPLCLVVFDTAVNHGVGVAQELLGQHSDPVDYLAARMLVYVRLANWARYGVAWGNRVKALLDVVRG